MQCYNCLEDHSGDDMLCPMCGYDRWGDLMRLESMSEEELREDQAVAKRVVVGQEFKHHRTNVIYQVVGVARNKNTDEVIVLYRSQNQAGLNWWRHQDEFMSKFDRVRK